MSYLVNWRFGGLRGASSSSSLSVKSMTAGRFKFDFGPAEEEGSRDEVIGVRMAEVGELNDRGGL